MAETIRLELSSLPERHPIGDVLLHDYGSATVYRLCVDPVRLADNIFEREMIVEHSRQHSEELRLHRVIIGCTGHLDWGFCVRAAVSKNSNDLTQHAALGIAGLTASHFEQAKILNVLQIGSGPDYAIEVPWAKNPATIEMSGLRRDDTPTGDDVRSRVVEKSGVVVTGCVSVTAFSHRATGSGYSVIRRIRVTQATESVQEIRK